MGNRFWLILVLSMSSACVLSPGLGDRPCDDEGNCVAGYQCVAGTCREQGADAGVADDGGVAADAGVDAGGSDAGTDDDAGSTPDAGVTPDAGMPCTGHDEDRDGLSDACDNCPHMPNPGQEDALEAPAAPDGVGDVCDPRPNDPGDRIELFEPFASAELAAWEVIGDPVSVSADALVIETVSEDTRVLRTINPVARPIVEIGVDSYTDPGIVNVIGAVLGGAAGEPLYCCYLYDFLGGLGAGWSSLPDGQSIPGDGATLDANLVDPPMPIRFDAREATTACAVGAAELDLTSASVGHRRVGVYGLNSTTRVSYLLVYSVGP